MRDQHFTFAYIFAAAKIGTDEAFALELPRVNTASMQEFLDCFAKTLTKGEVAALYLDQAGWKSSTALSLPVPR